VIDHRYRDLAGAAEEAARPPDFASVRRRAGRLRNRRRAGGALAAAVLLASGTAGVMTLRPSGQTWEAAAGGRRVLEVGAADAEHLYAIVADCDDCPDELLASSDGGRTWVTRERPEGVRGQSDLTVLGPRVLFESRVVGIRAAREGQKETDQDSGRRVSVDGGRAWREVTVSDAPVASVAPDTRAIDCRVVGGTAMFVEECPVYAVDPASGRFAPLANQPPLAFAQVVDTPVEAGLWAAGADPATGKAAVAVSHDRGRNWDAFTFDAEPTAVERRKEPPATFLSVRAEVATTDGNLAYATFIGPGPVVVYRSADGGRSWHLTHPSRPLAAPLAGPTSFVTADGAHVLPALNGSGFQYLASPDGRSYTRVDLAGLPAFGNSPRAVTKRFFLFQGLDSVYTSTDGRRWQQRLG